MSHLVTPCAAATDRTYYQVLDIGTDEQDPQVIEEAALRCSRHVRAYQITREAECTLRLNEIARALNTLLDPVRRREYDLSLAKPLSPVRSDRTPPTRRANGVPAPRADERALLDGDGETCDVRLVYPRRAR